MSKKHYQPIFWGDYFRDTADLCLLEHGAYLRLIGVYWSTGSPIPNDAKRMRSACGVQCEEDAQAVQYVLQRYFNLVGEVWRHSRIDRDLAEHAHRAEMASTAAKKAADARWSSGKSDAVSNASGMRSASVSHANHSTPPHIEDSTSVLSVLSENTETEKPKKANRRANPKNRLEQFLEQNGGMPPAEWGEYPRQRFGWGNDKLNDVFRAFKRYWTSPDCPKPLKADWRGTWENWCDREGARAGGGQSQNAYRSVRERDAVASVIEHAMFLEVGRAGDADR